MQVAAAIEISVATSQEVKRTALKAIASKKILSLWHQLTLVRFHLDTGENGGSPLAELCEPTPPANQRLQTVDNRLIKDRECCWLSEMDF